MATATLKKNFDNLNIFYNKKDKLQRENTSLLNIRHIFEDTNTGIYMNSLGSIAYKTNAILGESASIREMVKNDKGEFCRDISTLGLTSHIYDRLEKTKNPDGSSLVNQKRYNCVLTLDSKIYEDETTKTKCFYDLMQTGDYKAVFDMLGTQMLKENIKSLGTDSILYKELEANKKFDENGNELITINERKLFNSIFGGIDTSVGINEFGERVNNRPDDIVSDIFSSGKIANALINPEHKTNLDNALLTLRSQLLSLDNMKGVSKGRLEKQMGIIISTASACFSFIQEDVWFYTRYTEKVKQFELQKDNIISSFVENFEMENNKKPNNEEIREYWKEQVVKYCKEELPKVRKEYMEKVAKEYGLKITQSGENYLVENTKGEQQKFDDWYVALKNNGAEVDLYKGKLDAYYNERYKNGFTRFFVNSQGGNLVNLFTAVIIPVAMRIIYALKLAVSPDKLTTMRNWTGRLSRWRFGSSFNDIRATWNIKREHLSAETSSIFNPERLNKLFDGLAGMLDKESERNGEVIEPISNDDIQLPEKENMTIVPDEVVEKTNDKLDKEIEKEMKKEEKIFELKEATKKDIIAKMKDINEYGDKDTKERLNIFKNSKDGKDLKDITFGNIMKMYEQFKGFMTNEKNDISSSKLLEINDKGVKLEIKGQSGDYQTLELNTKKSGDKTIGNITIHTENGEYKISSDKLNVSLNQKASIGEIIGSMNKGEVAISKLNPETNRYNKVDANEKNSVFNEFKNEFGTSVEKANDKVEKMKDNIEDALKDAFDKFI